MEMAMERVGYDRVNHLDQMMSIASKQLASNGRVAGMHPGDVAHRIGSGLRNFSTDDVVHVWTEADRVAAFGLIWPDWDAFDFVCDPDLEPEVIEQIVSELTEITNQTGRVETEVYPGDGRLGRIVSNLGFTKTEEPYTITSQNLVDRRPVVVPGYTVRGARLDESARIRDAHVSAFLSSWTADQYRTYMETPPYDPDREIVAVADNGEVAAFAVVWLDEQNSVGYFEPVGTHSDHQRRGVGSAVLAAGMNLMFDRGMRCAVVMHDTNSDRNAAFYRSCGFRQIGRIERWVRESDPSTSEEGL